MADYLLYDGRYSGQQIDAFLSRVERTNGSGPLQAEIAGVRAKELPYGQYVAVEKIEEADGSVSLIFGVPQGRPGIILNIGGQFAFTIEDGNLILHYAGDKPPDFSINKNDGHLYLEIT